MRFFASLGMTNVLSEAKYEILRFTQDDKYLLNDKYPERSEAWKPAMIRNDISMSSPKGGLGHRGTRVLKGSPPQGPRQGYPYYSTATFVHGRGTPGGD